MEYILLRNIGDNSLTEEVKGVLLRTKTKETMRPMLQGRGDNIMKRKQRILSLNSMSDSNKLLYQIELVVAKKYFMGFPGGKLKSEG